MIKANKKLAEPNNKLLGMRIISIRHLNSCRVIVYGITLGLQSILRIMDLSWLQGWFKVSSEPFETTYRQLMK